MNHNFALVKSPLDTWRCGQIIKAIERMQLWCTSKRGDICQCFVYHGLNDKPYACQAEVVTVVQADIKDIMALLTLS